MDIMGELESSGSMTSISIPDHLPEAMWLFGFPDGADCPDALWWRTDDHTITPYVNCNDLFWWGTADCEPVEAEDMPLLRKTFDDLKNLGAKYYLPDLFCARKREMRPQKPWLDRVEPKVLELFLEVGPGREH